MAIQLLLANFLYSPPGLLTIANPRLICPSGWFLSPRVVFIDWHGYYRSGTDTQTGAGGTDQAPAVISASFVHFARAGWQ